MVKKAKEIIVSLGRRGIGCRIDRDCVDGCIPVFDRPGSRAYVIVEQGLHVVEGPTRVMVPLFDNPSEEHVEMLSDAIQDETVMDAVLVIQNELMGLVVFVQ